MSGDVLLPGLLAAASLLLLAGIGKLRQPATAAAFLGSLGLPMPLLLVRVGALLEIAGGAAVFVWPRTAAVGMALLFLVFAALITAQLRQPVSRPCGCLGTATSPASRMHLGLNLICAVVCVAAAAGRPPSLSTLVASNLLVAAVSGLVGVAVALLAAAAVDLFPETIGAWRGAGV